MHIPDTLKIELLSDATFAKGSGKIGVVDTETAADAMGFPMIPGRTLQGLLTDEWSFMKEYYPELHEAADELFGKTQQLNTSSILRIGTGCLPNSIRKLVKIAINKKNSKLSPELIMNAFTDIRNQTAEDAITGAAKEHSLRTTRVIIRQTSFYAELNWLVKPNEKHLEVLAKTVLAVRNAGLNRTRGRGHVKLSLEFQDKNITLDLAKLGGKS